MQVIQQEFQVPFRYKTYFTENLFELSNPLLKNILEESSSNRPSKILVAIDQGVVENHPKLQNQVIEYCQHYADTIDLKTVPIVIPGGEAAKNDYGLVDYLLGEIDENNICRHSYLIGIGGGAVLDMLGYTAAIAHRGIRHIRIPTTVLSQNDSGVGVKNSINFFNKKNFLGTFKPPQAVINDCVFLETLSSRDWRSGISEALKVALIKDQDFFQEILDNIPALIERGSEAMQSLIYRCAELHLEHISSGDPFEMGSSRPLDFGHWAAHKLEQLSEYRLRHGEAVAMGIALDVTYSYLKGMIQADDYQIVIQLILDLGFDIYCPEMSQNLEQWSSPQCLLSGLEEFREHLGGQLTIMLIEEIGQGIEVHQMDYDLIIHAIEELKLRQSQEVQASTLNS